MSADGCCPWHQLMSLLVKVEGMVGTTTPNTLHERNPS